VSISSTRNEGVDDMQSHSDDFITVTRPSTSTHTHTAAVMHDTPVLQTIVNNVDGASVQNKKISYSDALKLVTLKIADSDRCKGNLIISGLQESANQIDADVFGNVCFSDLSIDLHSKIIATKRLGNIDGCKSRRLLVILDSSSTALEVYSSARSLRL